MIDRLGFRWSGPSRSLSGCIGAALGLVVLLGCAEAVAQQQVTRSEDVAERAIGKLRSPYCPGLMLEVCPSPEAGALRDSIRDLARNGAAEGELVEWMIGRHGEEWRAVPKRSGRGMLAWLVPPAFLLLGAGLLVARLRRNNTEPEPEAPPVDTLSEAERGRLAAALAEWDGVEELEP